jgi:hypothetical protein
MRRSLSFICTFFILFWCKLFSQFEVFCCKNYLCLKTLNMEKLQIGLSVLTFQGLQRNPTRCHILKLHSEMLKKRQFWIEFCRIKFILRNNLDMKNFLFLLKLWAFIIRYLCNSFVYYISLRLDIISKEIFSSVYET